MASIASIQFTIHGLRKSQATALRKKAERLGVSTEDYVRDLIAMDLELDKAVTSGSFAELAMPFQKAVAGLSDQELDAMATRPRTKVSQ